jgi:oxygen-independent coproporphyrinogen III oxidase
VLSLAPDRAAVYSFAFVPEVRPHQKRLALLPMALGMEKVGLFGQAYEAFVQAGYRPIGMDHFARPGDELCAAQSERALRRNFQGYTVCRATDVVGIGVSAISDIGGAYAQNVQALAKYYDRIGRGELATERGIELDADDRERRRIIESLMCNFVVELGANAEAELGPELEALAQLERDGLVRLEGHTVTVPEEVRILVRNVAMVFDRRLRAQGTRAFSRTI